MNTVTFVALSCMYRDGALSLLTLWFQIQLLKLPETTPNINRKTSLNEADVEVKPEAKDIGEKSSFGGSQGSLNSASSSSFTANDNPEQFESQKQIKEVMEQGIEK